MGGEKAQKLSNLYVEPWALQGTSRAREEWDVQKFKAIRSGIISGCQRRIDIVLLQVFRYDAKNEGDHQATTQEDNDCRIAEDHDNKTEDDSDGKIEEVHDKKLGDH